MRSARRQTRRRGRTARAIRAAIASYAGPSRGRYDVERVRPINASQSTGTACRNSSTRTSDQPCLRRSLSTRRITASRFGIVGHVRANDGAVFAHERIRLIAFVPNRGVASARPADARSFGEDAIRNKPVIGLKCGDDVNAVIRQRRHFGGPVNNDDIRSRRNRAAHICVWLDRKDVCPGIGKRNRRDARAGAGVGNVRLAKTIEHGLNRVARVTRPVKRIVAGARAEPRMVESLIYCGSPSVTGRPRV